MEGIAKFAHLVNIEFFRDLLKVLKNIIKGDGSMDDEDEEEFVGPDVVGKGIETRLRMLAIVTAFELLSGQGESFGDIFISITTNVMFARR